MPPPRPATVHIKLSGGASLPCNASSKSSGGGVGAGPCVVTMQLTNLTIAGISAGGGEENQGQDDEGAMRFIIAVLLVYSLMGTAGMLILRIRQSATKANKKGAMKEANRYLKYRDKLSAECHKAKLVKETNRILTKMRTLEWQRSQTESLGPSSPDDGGAGDQAPLLQLTQSHLGRDAHRQNPLPPISESNGEQLNTSHDCANPLHIPEHSGCYSDSNPETPRVFTQLSSFLPSPSSSSPACSPSVLLLPAELVDRIASSFLSSLGTSKDCSGLCHLIHADEMSKRTSNNVEHNECADGNRYGSENQERLTLKRDQNNTEEAAVSLTMPATLASSKHRTPPSKNDSITKGGNASDTTLNGTLNLVHGET